MIYFIREMDGEYVKIGFSSQPRDRLNSIVGHNPRNLEIALTIEGNRNVERFIHRKFAAHRHKFEWFRWCKEIEDFCLCPIMGPDNPQISPKDEIFMRRRLSGESYSSIGRDFGMTRQAVHQRIHRANTALQRSIK